MKCKKKGCERRAVENGYCKPCLTALWKAVEKLPMWPPRETDKVLHPGCAGGEHQICAWPTNCPCDCHKDSVRSLDDIHRDVHGCDE